MTEFEINYFTSGNGFYDNLTLESIQIVKETVPLNSYGFKALVYMLQKRHPNLDFDRVRNAVELSDILRGNKL